MPGFSGQPRSDMGQRMVACACSVWKRVPLVQRRWWWDGSAGGLDDFIPRIGCVVILFLVVYSFWICFQILNKSLFFRVKVFVIDSGVCFYFGSWSDVNRTQFPTALRPHISIPTYSDMFGRPWEPLPFITNFVQSDSISCQIMSLLLDLLICQSFLFQARMLISLFVFEVVIF